MRLGADPETFLISPQGKHLSAIGKIKANKENPFQIPHLPKGFTLQEDNVSLEFGIPPASSAKEFSDYIEIVMREGLSKLPGTMFSTLSCVVFPKDQMTSPEAFVFGCEPDFNAWKDASLDEDGIPQNINNKPQPSHKFMRSAGGHVHIETDLDKQNVVRAFDLFSVVPSLLMDNGHQRRQLYGGPGCYRPKPYGVECRSLSNFWIFKPELREWVWRQSERAINWVKAHDDVGSGQLLNNIGDLLQVCINTNNKDLAKLFVKDYDLEVI